VGYLGFDKYLLHLVRSNSEEEEKEEEDDERTLSEHDAGALFSMEKMLLILSTGLENKLFGSNGR